MIMRNALALLTLVLLFPYITVAQTAEPSPTPTPTIVRMGTIDTSTIVHERVKDGIFFSERGDFSIAIPEMPGQTIEQGSDKAVSKGIDVGKQFVWIIGRTLYTIFYDTGLTKDGEPYAIKYDDMEIGTRKGVYNSGGTVLSEVPIKYGVHRGTEFRYRHQNGVRYIGRIYLIGKRGYQIVGGYADAKDEQKVIDVLDSFKSPLK